MRGVYVAMVLLIAGLLAGCGDDDLQRNPQSGAGIFTTPTLPPAPLSSAAALIALAPEDGSELWRAPAPHEWTLTTFLTDETVYAYASDDGVLVAIDLETHEQRWSFQAEGHGWLPVPTDGAVYIPKGRSLLAVDEMTGSELWSVAELTPLAANAEMVFAVTGDGGLVALDAKTGKERWRTGLSVRAVRPSGDTIYLSVWGIRGAEDSVRAFDALTGEELWARSFPSPGPDLVDIADGNVYVFLSQVSRVNEQAQLVALDAVTGDERWRAAGGVVVWHGIHGGAATGDGMIATFLNEDRLVALDSETGAARWEVDQARSDVVYLDGSVIVVERFDDRPRDDHLDPQMVARAFDAASGEQRWERSIDDFGGLPAGYSAVVAGNGQLFIVKP